MLYTSPCLGFKFTTSVVIGTDCIGSCKSNYHTITATTAQTFIDSCLIITEIQINFNIITVRPIRHTPGKVGGDWDDDDDDDDIGYQASSLSSQDGDRVLDG